VPTDQEILDEIISIHSSSSSMNREELISRIVALETAEVVRAWAITHTTAAACNQAIHDRVLAATTGIAPVIMSMDTYTLWWVSQWINCRTRRIAENGDPAVERAAHVRSYRE
jgi:hypothetical protein